MNENADLCAERAEATQSGAKAARSLRAQRQLRLLKGPTPWVGHFDVGSELPGWGF